MSQIKDINLAKSGHDKINWVKSYMPVLNKINEEFTRTKPFAGKKISMSIHLEAKTAYLAITLAAGGARGICHRVQPALDAGRRRGGARRPRL